MKGNMQHFRTPLRFFLLLSNAVFLCEGTWKLRAEGDALLVMTGPVTSTKNVFPYTGLFKGNDYWSGFTSPQNIGEAIKGKKIEPASFTALMCKRTSGKLSDADTEKLTDLARNGYRAHFSMLGLPLTDQNGQLGVSISGDPGLLTSLNFVVTYYEWEENTRKPPLNERYLAVTGFEVKPGYGASDGNLTYSFSYVKTHERRELRKYMEAPASRHFVIAINYMVTAFAAMLMFLWSVRRREKDVLAFNIDEAPSNGWWNAQGDAFRSPNCLSFLLLLVGSGCQLYATLAMTSVCVLIGLLDVSEEGSVLTGFVFFSSVFGVFFAGYTSTAVAQLASRTLPHFAPFLLSTVVPLLIVFFYTITSSIHSVMRSTASFTPDVVSGIGRLWVFMAVPLCFAGVFARNKHKLYPRTTAEKPRPEPEIGIKQTTMFTVFLFLSMIPSVLGVVRYCWLETFFKAGVNYLPGFQVMGFAAGTVTTCSVTVFFTFRYIHYEQHRWWWRAFLVPFFVTFVLVFTVVYVYLTGLSLSPPAMILCLVYGLGASLALALASGAVSFMAALYFVVYMFPV